MKKLYMAAVCGVMLLLTGCPYNSGQQLGSPSARTFDTAILGIWTGCSAEKTADCGRLVLYRFNEAEYYAELTGIERPGSNRNINIATDRYRAFMTDIGVPGLLDVQELSVSTDTPGAHFFVKAELQADNTLKVSYMSDEFAKEKFSTAGELADYIRKNHTKPGFYETLQDFKREKEK